MCHPSHTGLSSQKSQLASDSVVTCPAPTAPVNGMLRSSNSKGFHMSGSIITFQCKDGFTLKGNTSSICLPNGDWNDHPTCEGEL